MTALRTVLSRLWAFPRSRQLDRDIDDEIAGYLAEATDEYVRQGLSLEDATSADGDGETSKREEAMRPIRTIASVGLMLLFAAIAHAECVTVAVDVPRDLKQADLVFAGTVIGSGVDRLTFSPDRIWKGRPAGREIVVYLIGDLVLESYVFQEGQRYVIFARLLQPAERIFIADNSDAFGIYRPCGTPVWTLSVIPELDRITRGRKP